MFVGRGQSIAPFLRQNMFDLEGKTRRHGGVSTTNKRRTCGVSNGSFFLGGGRFDGDVCKEVMRRFPKRPKKHLKPCNAPPKRLKRSCKEKSGEDLRIDSLSVKRVRPRI